MIQESRQGGRPTRVLILGGTSNAARNVREFLSRQTGYEVIVHTRKPSIALRGEMVTQVQDYREKIPDDLDAVISFIGCVHGSAEMHQHVNVDLQTGIARAVKAAKARCLINISTLAVYGDVERIDSSTPERPVAAYGESKLEGDRQLLLEVDDALRVVVLRVPALYGDGMPGKISTLARLIGKVGIMPVLRVSGMRSTLHVENLARTLCELVDSDLDGIQFGSDPDLFSIDQLVEAIEKRKSRRVWTPLLPPAVLRLMYRAMPAITRSLYGESVIDPALLLKSENYPPLPLAACLERAF